MSDNLMDYNRAWDSAYQNVPYETDGLPVLWQEKQIPYLDDRRIIKFLRDHHVNSILEAGCGDGRNGRHLANVLGGYVTAVDVSPTALTIASKIASQEGLNRIVYVQQDITNMENFVGESFDAVVCADCLGQVPNPEDALAEFMRLLRPNGVILFNLFTPEDSTCGVGEQVGALDYVYKGTLFRFFTEEMVRQLVSAWEDVEIRQYPWLDPPHGDFRPAPHMHDSWVVTARKPGGRHV